MSHARDSLARWITPSMLAEIAHLVANPQPPLSRRVDLCRCFVFGERGTFATTYTYQGHDPDLLSYIAPRKSDWIASQPGTTPAPPDDEWELADVEL